MTPADTPAAPPAADDRSLEEAMARLDAILERMEEGDLPLEQLLADFEEGAGLIKFCQERLQAAEKKISLITKSLDGVLQAEEFRAGPETD